MLARLQPGQVGPAARDDHVGVQAVHQGLQGLGVQRPRVFARYRSLRARWRAAAGIVKRTWWPRLSKPLPSAQARMPDPLAGISPTGQHVGADHQHLFGQAAPLVLDAELVQRGEVRGGVRRVRFVVEQVHAPRLAEQGE